MKEYTLANVVEYSASDEGFAESDENQSPPCHVRPSRRSCIVGYALLAIGMIGCIGTILLIWPQIGHISSNTSCWCGSSLAEAISLNCKYDSISASWLPAHCRDDELAKEFDHAGPGPDGSWTFYTDENMTQILDQRQVAALGGSTIHFYATHEWHISHCAWFWRKQVRASQTGVTIEERFRGIWHVEHCEMMFKRRGGLNDIIAHTGVALGGDRNVGAHKHNE